ncbi:MAG: hypothetical protein ACRDD3_03470 [Azovibrio sp.]
MLEKFPDLLTQISLVEKRCSSSLCSHLADEFEDDLFEYADFPEAHFDFFLTLLSDKRYCNQPGIWNFILAVNNARDALINEQYEHIVNTFAANFENYSDNDLCLAVCNFVARNLEPSKAAGLLKKLKQQELKKSIDLQGNVDEGFFILGQEIKRVAKRWEVSFTMFVQWVRQVVVGIVRIPTLPSQFYP